MAHILSSSLHQPSPSFSNCDSTEAIIARMIEGIRTFLNPQYGNTTPEEEAAAVIKINPATRQYCEHKIKILQNSPRDSDKLRELLQVKQKEYEKAENSEVIERLVTEIEMLEFVLLLVNRNTHKENN